MAKIVNTCNRGGDYPDEKFVEGLPRLQPETLRQICDIINNATNGPYFHADRYYKVVEDDYELQPGFEP